MLQMNMHSQTSASIQPRASHPIFSKKEWRQNSPGTFTFCCDNACFVVRCRCLASLRTRAVSCPLTAGRRTRPGERRASCSERSLWRASERAGGLTKLLCNFPSSDAIGRIPGSMAVGTSKGCCPCAVQEAVLGSLLLTQRVDATVGVHPLLLHTFSANGRPKRGNGPPRRSGELVRRSADRRFGGLSRGRFRLAFVWQQAWQG